MKAMLLWFAGAIAPISGCAMASQSETTDATHHGSEEDGEIPEMSTDRPDRTEGSSVVPPGYVQVEVGATYAKDDEEEHVERLSGPETLLRIGMMKDLELRLGFSGYMREQIHSPDGPGEDFKGFGDSEVGLKWKLWEERRWRPETAILGSLSLPTGDSSFSTERFDPSLLFLFSHTLTERLELGYNLGVAWETESNEGDRDTLASFLYSTVLGVGLSDRLGAFFEFFGDAPINGAGDAAHSFDTGLTYALTENLQLDGAVGFGLTDEADDWFASIGMSYRFALRR